METLRSKTIIEALPSLYATENIQLQDKLVVARLFVPNWWAWYIFEGQPLTAEEHEACSSWKSGDYRYFGMVHGNETEMGYFLLSELFSIRYRKANQLLIQRDHTVFKVPYCQFMR